MEPTAQIWMKIDPCCQRQEYRPMTLLSRNIRFMFMRIFAGVPLAGGVKRHRRLSTTAIFDDLHCRWLRLRKLQRYGKQYYMTICYPLSTGNWLQNKWPWMTLDGYFMTKSGQQFLNQSVRMLEIVGYNLCDSAVFCELHDQSASLCRPRHAQLTRCFSAVAELLVHLTPSPTNVHNNKNTL